MTYPHIVVVFVRKEDFLIPKIVGFNDAPSAAAMSNPAKT